MVNISFYKAQSLENFSVVRCKTGHSFGAKPLCSQGQQFPQYTKKRWTQEAEITYLHPSRPEGPSARRKSDPPHTAQPGIHVFQEAALTWMKRQGILCWKTPVLAAPVSLWPSMSAKSPLKITYTVVVRKASLVPCSLLTTGPPTRVHTTTNTTPGPGRYLAANPKAAGRQCNRNVA